MNERNINNYGYRIRSMGDGSQRLEHILIAEQHLGRKLAPGEVVHHLNRDKLDNRIESLLVVTRSWHKRIHGEIGVATRLKKVWFLDGATLYKRYLELGSAQRVANEIGCSEATIRRTIKAQLGHYLRKEVTT